MFTLLFLAQGFLPLAVPRLGMAALSDRINGIVHEPTQVHDDAVDLTVAEVYEVTEPGRIDFGGGELEPAALEPHDRTWRNDEDDYQWWHLDAGTYLIEHNETLATEERVIVQPRDELLARGASHPTVHTTALDRLPLTVGGDGIRLKENARVSTVVE